MHHRLGDVNFEGCDVYSWVEFGKRIPFVRALLDGYAELYKQPFRGVTASDEVEQGLFSLREEDAPVNAMVEAAEILVAEAKAANVSKKLRCPLDANEWRCWMNPEFYFSRDGLRFEEYPENLRAAALNLIQASLSQRG